MPFEANHRKDDPKSPQVIHLRSYDDVRAAFRDSRLLIHKPLYQATQTNRTSRPAESPPPSRTRRVAPVSKSLANHLAARQVGALAPFISEQIISSLRGGLEQGGMDLVQDLTYPLTIKVMLHILDLPATELQWFRSHFDTMTAGMEIGSSSRRIKSALFSQTILSNWIAGHLGRGSSPLVEAMRSTAASLAEDRMLHYWSTMLLYAGAVTTRGFLGNCLAWLIENPYQYRHLAANPNLLDCAIEELLRVEGSVRAVGRIAGQDIKLGGLEIPKGSLVYLDLHAANRDPDWFPAPDDVDLARNPNPHMAFGCGVTACLGAQLARLETRLMLSHLMPYFDQVQPTGFTGYIPSTIVRERSALPVVFT